MRVCHLQRSDFKPGMDTVGIDVENHEGRCRELFIVRSTLPLILVAPSGKDGGDLQRKLNNVRKWCEALSYGSDSCRPEGRNRGVTIICGRVTFQPRSAIIKLIKYKSQHGLLHFKMRRTRWCHSFLAICELDHELEPLSVVTW